jgi:transcriptional regulator with XRE-family HTH domain
VDDSQGRYEVTSTIGNEISFGNNLRAARKAAGMSQGALARICGLERQYISKLERGRTDPRVSMLIRLATGLGIPAAELLTETGIAPRCIC